MKPFLYSPIDMFDTNPDTDTDRVEVRRIKMLSKVKNKGTIISWVQYAVSFTCMLAGNLPTLAYIRIVMA